MNKNYYSNKSAIVILGGTSIKTYIDKSHSFIKKYKEQPFFVYLPTNTPHRPLEITDEYLDKYIPRTEIDIYKHVVNFIKKDRAKQLILYGVSQQRELLQKIESVKNFEWGINPVDNENRMCELIKLL